MVVWNFVLSNRVGGVEVSVNPYDDPYDDVLPIFAQFSSFFGVLVNFLGQFRPILYKRVIVRVIVSVSVNTDSPNPVKS